MKTIFDEFAIQRFHQDIYGEDNAFYSGSFKNESNGSLLTFTVSNRSGAWAVSGTWLKDSHDFTTADEAFNFLGDEVGRLETEKNTTYMYPDEAKVYKPDCLDRFRWDTINFIPDGSVNRITHIKGDGAELYIRLFLTTVPTEAYFITIGVNTAPSIPMKEFEYSFTCKEDTIACKFLLGTLQYLDEWLSLDIKLPEFHGYWEDCPYIPDTREVRFNGGMAYVVFHNPIYEARLITDTDKEIYKETFNSEEEAYNSIESQIRAYVIEHETKC